MTSAVSVITKEQAPDLLRSQNQSLLATLPRDVIVKILQLLSPYGVAAVGLTCRHLNVVSKDNHLWRFLYNRAFSTHIPKTYIEEGACLRAYKNFHSNLKNGVYASQTLEFPG